MPRVATYLLLFPYCKMYHNEEKGKVELPTKKAEREMNKTIVNSFGDNGYEPCSVWSFTKSGVDKYGSVEHDEYIGVGAEAMSTADKYFYANTGSVEEYIQALEKEALPISIESEPSPEGVAAGWLSMSLNGMGFDKPEFEERFNIKVYEKFKWLLRCLKLFGIIDVNENSVQVTRKEMWYIHLMTKTFPLTFIAKACEECLENPPVKRAYRLTTHRGR